MAVTITRTNWIDDDGSGTTGTVINNAEKTTIYNQIDAALAQLAQLSGGNTFTGNQSINGNVGINGVLAVNALGPHTFIAAGATVNSIILQNAAAGAGAYAYLSIGNDTSNGLLSLFSFSSTYASSVDTTPNGSTVRASGAGGLTINTSNASAPMRFLTNFAERMRIAPTGEILVNCPAPLQLAKVMFVADGAAGNGVMVQNLNATSTNMYFHGFLNSAGAVQGTIAGVGSTSVAFNTTSDARLKTDRGRAVDLSALRGVVVHDFTWKADGVRSRGVFAQEAYDVFPRAVTEGTDDETPEGHLARPWMTDYSKFVPDLIAGFQQHDAELAALRAAFATLKGSTDAQ